MRIGEVHDAKGDFDASHVVFTVNEFYEALERLRNNCFLVFDEAGLGFSHREFQSAINKMLGMTFQTFRYKYINVIFTLPKLGFMDTVGRSLLHGVIRMTDRGEGIIYRSSPDYLGDKVFHYREGQLAIAKPSQKLLEAYEDKKVKFLEEKYASFKAEAKSQTRPFRYMSLNELASEVRKQKEAFEVKGEIDPLLIAAKMDLGTNKAYLVKRLVEVSPKG